MSGWLWFLIYLALSTLTLKAVATQQRNFRFIISDFYFKPTVAGFFESINWELRNYSSISAFLILERNIDELEMETSLDMLRPNKQLMRLYHMRLDACQFLTTIHKNRIFNLFAKSVNRGSKGLLKCPLIAHFNYTISDMHVDEIDFPQYVPECQFKTLTKFYTQKKMVLRLVMDGRVEYKN